MQFDDSALNRLVERAEAERMKMGDLCAHLFKDFQFGLSLIKKNTGKNSFVLGSTRSTRRTNSSVNWCCNPMDRAAIARRNEARAARDTLDWRGCRRVGHRAANQRTARTAGRRSRQDHWSLA